MHVSKLLNLQVGELAGCPIRTKRGTDGLSGWFLLSAPRRISTITCEECVTIESILDKKKTKLLELSNGIWEMVFPLCYLLSPTVLLWSWTAVHHVLGKGRRKALWVKGARGVSSCSVASEILKTRWLSERDIFSFWSWDGKPVC